MQVLSARLGLSSVNPIAEGLDTYSGMLNTLDGLLGPAPRTSSQWIGFGRLDKTVSERQKLTLEGTGALWDSPGGGLTRASETYGTHSYGSSRADDQWILSRWEAFLTPNLLAVTQGSIGRQFLTTPAENPSTFEQSLIDNAWGRLPQMTVDSRYGFVIGNPSRFGPGGYPDEHLYEAQEQLSWVRGGLMLKGGFDFRHNNDATGMIRNQTGTYDYASVENFASDALSFAAFGLNGQLNPENSTIAIRPARCGATPAALCMDSAICLVIPGTPRPWVHRIGGSARATGRVSSRRSGNRKDSSSFQSQCAGRWSRVRRRSLCLAIRTCL
jgi:hypothetical protein